MARSRELRVQIVGDTKNLGRSLDRTGRQLGDLETRTARVGSAMTTAFKGAALAAGTLAVAGLGASVKAAVEAERSQKQLDAQLKAVGSSLRTQSAAVQDVIQKHSMLAGIDDEDLQNAFGNIVRASGDVKKSLDLVGLAADVARGKHMDVAKAGELVGKVAGGNIGILARYGIVIKDGATATEALGTLQKRFAGQAKAYGKTTEGEYQRLRVTLENLGEKIGTKLLPHLVNAAKFLLRFLNQMERGEGTGGRFAKNVTNVANAIADMIRWIKKAIENTNAWGDATRRNLINVWRNVQRVFGNVMAGVFRGFEKLFDLGSKIPGRVGDNFDKAQAAAGRAAKSVDRLGERVRNLPDGKKIKIQVSTLLDDFNAGKVPKLFPMGGPGGGPSQEDMMGGLTGAVTGQAKTWAKQHKSAFMPMLGQPGGALPGGLGEIRRLSLAMGLSGGLGQGQGVRPGDDGWHGSGRALDNSGSASAMMAFARLMFTKFGSRLLELIYTPMGMGIKNGKPVNIASFYGPDVAADHYDHVHVAMNRGGKVPGSGSGDTVRAALTPGEHVLTVPEVRNAGGHGAIFALRRALGGGGQATGPGMASGGIAVAAQAAYQAGFRGQHLVNMVAIAGRESTYNPRAQNLTPPDHSIGLWQINQLAHKGRYGSDAALMNPLTNAKAAFALFKSSGYSPWVGVHYGNAASYLDDARAAVANLGRGGKLSSGSTGWTDKGDNQESAPWVHKGGRVGDKTKLSAGVHRYEDGSALRVKDGKIVAWQAASKAGRKAYRNRPVPGATSDYESDIAQADRRLGKFENAEGAPGKVETLRLMQKAQLLATRRQRIKTRLRTINKALQGKLKPATRSRLKSEKAALLGELGTVESDWRGVGERLHATNPPAEAADSGGGDGGDPNQPLIDALTASAEAAKQHAEELKALKEEVAKQNAIATSTLGIGYREATKALADVISGQIAGYTNQRARSAGDGIVGARY